MQGTPTPPTMSAGAVSRRSVLLGAASAAAGLGMPFIGNAAAAAPIRIGMIWGKAGSIAVQGEYLAQGCTLAVEQQNGMVLDRPIELVWVDEVDPQTAQQNAQHLIDDQKVVALIGGTLSSHALAISAVARRAKVPFVAANAAAADLTGKACNRYTFRLQPSADVQSRLLAPYALERGKRWYLLVPSYAFGQDIKTFNAAFLRRAGGTVVGTDDVPVATADYSSYILKIRQAKPDVVIGGLAASDLTTFLKQWNELGMKGRIPFAEIAVGATDIWGVGPEAATGTYAMTWYYNDPNNTPDDKAFAAAYQKKHGRPAADKAWMGWFGMKSLLGGIALAKSTDAAAIVTGMERWTAQDGDVTVRYRAWDHQMLRRTLIVETKPKITDKWDYFDVKAALPVKAADLDAAFGTPQDVHCTMDQI